MTLNIKKIDYSKRFLKQLEKAPIKIKLTFQKKLTFFTQDPFYPQLNNHALGGKLQGYRSINITGDWRAIYSETINESGETLILFAMIGTHSQLYK